jgi:Fe-S-cluster containining protein
MSSDMEVIALPILTDNPSCVGCGACCLNITMPPMHGYDDDDLEFRELPDELKRELIERWDSVFGDERKKLNGRITNSVGSPCSWLDMETKRCLHYEHRPVLCQEYQPGCNVCVEVRDLAGLGPLLSDPPAFSD